MYHSTRYSGLASRCSVIQLPSTSHEQFVTSLIAQMNCWTEIDKSNAIDEVFRRVDFVKDLIRERNMDYERSDRI